MGWLEGLLTGYVHRRNEIERENMQIAEDRAVREGQVYKDLLYSPDPVVKRMAQAGILELGGKRKRSGIAGWLGHMETSPTYQSLLRYANTPQGREVYDDDGTPVPQSSVPVTGGAIPTAPAQAGSAAQPVTSPTTASPMTPTVSPGAGGAAEPPPQLPMLPVITPGGAAGPSQMAVDAAAPPLPPELMLQGAPPPPPPKGQTTALIPPQTRKTRTNLQIPDIYPTEAQIKGETARATIGGTIGGTIDAYTDMYLKQGYSLPEARREAAELYENTHVRAGGSGTPYTAMEFDVKDPATGVVSRQLGWQDRRNGQYLDMNKQPFLGSITKAVPYQQLGGDVYYRMAMAALGYHPAEVARNPGMAQEVAAKAEDLSGRRAYSNAEQRLQAGSDADLSAPAKATLTRALSAQWNALYAPIRQTELFYRNLVSSYDQYKGGNKVAWEPFRTSFVHVSETGSVVMPSEFGRASDIGSWAQRLLGQFDRALEGGSPLTPDLIDQMMQVSQAIWKGLETFGAQQRGAIEAQADAPGVNIPHERIFGPPGARYDPTPNAGPDAKPDVTAKPGGPPKAPDATAKPEYYWDDTTKTFRIRGAK